MATGAPTLTWNSISGAVYHVISATNMMQSAWLNVSGPLTAAGANTTWTDIGSDPKLPCFYRVVSP
jgi:hypothetical protein